MQPSMVSSPRPLMPQVIFVTPRERENLRAKAEQLAQRFKTSDNPFFLAYIHIYAHCLLPMRIKRILARFAGDCSGQQYGALIFRQLVTVDQLALGPTPTTYHEVDSARITVYGFISLLLHAGLGAHVIMQSCQRKGLAGGLIHSLIPTPGMEDKLVGEGTVQLPIHTEDSYLRAAARYLSMFFLRNFEAANSLLYSIRSHDLNRPYVRQLFLPDFNFPGDPNGPQDSQYRCAKKGAVLFGKPELPFLAYDPVEMLNPKAGQSPAAQQALLDFGTDVEKLIYTAYVPQAGDFVLVNNRLCCHGRGTFRAGMRLENGQLVECPKRWMLRVMSVGCPIDYFPDISDDHAHLVTEM